MIYFGLIIDDYAIDEIPKFKGKAAREKIIERLGYRNGFEVLMRDHMSASGQHKTRSSWMDRYKIMHGYLIIGNYAEDSLKNNYCDEIFNDLNLKVKIKK